MDSEPFVHRRAASTDLDELLVLIRAFYELDGHDFVEEHVRLALSALLVDDAYGQVWITERDDPPRAIGYAVVTWSYSLESGGRDCILDEIYLQTRSNGLGTSLLRHALRHATAAGARAVFLETESHNIQVRRFYERNGFATDDSVWMSQELGVLFGDGNLTTIRETL